MSKIAVLGAGSWGTALASILSYNNHETVIYTTNEKTISDINEKHINSKYLGNSQLPLNLKASNDLETTLEKSSYVLFVVPSHAMREVARKSKEFIPKDATIIHASKGFEIETLDSMTKVLQEELGENFSKKIVTFSGPSHAEEVIKKMPTAIVAACSNLKYAEKVQSIFSNDYIRVYTSTDFIGVELGGSIKNIIAIGAGLIDGLGYGDNTKAALLTRGLAEMSKLGLALGANEKTFMGLAGIGDLIVTGTSVHSRNWKTGHQLGQGKSLEEALSSLGMVAEGVKTTKAIKKLAEKLNIDLPITSSIYNVLFENKNPKEEIKKLMQRKVVDEFYFFN